MRREERRTVLYDAGCGLCEAAVAFVSRKARPGRFAFAPLDSSEGRRLIADGPPPGETMILFDADGRHERSTAALRIAAHLRRPWSWLRWLRLVPRPLRDAAYDFVARRRINWFGPAPACRPGSRCPHPDRR